MINRLFTCHFLLVGMKWTCTRMQNKISYDSGLCTAFSCANLLETLLSNTLTLKCLFCMGEKKCGMLLFTLLLFSKRNPTLPWWSMWVCSLYVTQQECIQQYNDKKCLSVELSGPYNVHSEVQFMKQMTHTSHIYIS